MTRRTLLEFFVEEGSDDLRVEFWKPGNRFALMEINAALDVIKKEVVEALKDNLGKHILYTGKLRINKESK